MFQSINAVTLVTHDMKASCDFYSKLGLYITYGGANSPFTTFSANQSPVRPDNNILHINLYLSKTYKPPIDGKWNEWGRCILYVKDVDALYLSLTQQDVATEDEPKDAVWGERFFHALDPNGHQLSFATPIYNHPRWHRKDKSSSSPKRQKKESIPRTHLVRKLLKGIETGDPESASVVNEDKYIQHNPQTKEGSEGLAALFARISKTNPRVNVVRAFDDGDYVFGHTEYFFSTARVGFEVFRFDVATNQAVEHWDNIQPRQGKGRSMVEGPTEATDLHLTETNRQFIKDFTEQVMINQKFDDDLMGKFVSKDLIQHSPHITTNGLEAMKDFYGTSRHIYKILHRVLSCGNFCLSVCEGYQHKQEDAGGDGIHTSFYDLYRIDNGRIAEHWDTVEHVPPKSEWKNQNGKF